jgi:ankyrin repeat protein
LINYLADIWKSCKDGDLDMVRIMIREGEDMNDVTTHMGNTPMHFAARNGHYLVVKYLLELGA